MQAQYRGFTIIYDENKDVWECGALKNASLKKLKSTIDSRLRSNFTRTAAYLVSFEAAKEVTVTSVTPDRKFCFVVDAQGNKSKESVDYVFAASEENQKIADEMIEIVEARRSLKEEYSTLRRKLKWKPLLPTNQADLDKAERELETKAAADIKLDNGEDKSDVS